MRERISRGALARLDAAAADGEALRRWAGFLALAVNLPLALRLVWESATSSGGWAGDPRHRREHYSSGPSWRRSWSPPWPIRLKRRAEAASDHLATQIRPRHGLRDLEGPTPPHRLATQLATALGHLRYGR